MRKTPFIHIAILTAFVLNTFGPMPIVQAQEFRLPAIGAMVHLSPAFNPPILKGIKVNPDNPFKFDFILDQGDHNESLLQQDATRLIKYFLASLTVPEKDLWVNLSPYEKNRIVPDAFGKTEMGRDLLAEDYMLKQITASLIYPEDEIGKKFWKRVYEEARKKFGTTSIPVNTFNKVWIVPQKAVVYENVKAGTAYVVESKLKVMLEQDYLAFEKNQRQPGDMALAVSPSTLPNDAGLNTKASQGNSQSTNAIGSQIVREIVIPELNKEVNEGKNFAQLRQVYNSLILAAWYKKKIRDSILARVYADRNKTAGVQYNHSIRDSSEEFTPESFNRGPQNDTEFIYQRYLQAFKKGVYNYIKEEQDPLTNQSVPRKYFSGGFFGAEIDRAMTISENAPANLNASAPVDITVNLSAVGSRLDAAMLAYSEKEVAQDMRDPMDIFLSNPIIAQKKLDRSFLLQNADAFALLLYDISALSSPNVDEVLNEESVRDEYLRECFHDIIDYSRYAYTDGPYAADARMFLWKMGEISSDLFIKDLGQRKVLDRKLPLDQLIPRDERTKDDFILDIATGARGLYFMKQYRNERIILTDSSYFVEAFLNRGKKRFGIGNNLIVRRINVRDIDGLFQEKQYKAIRLGNVDTYVDGLPEGFFKTLGERVVPGGVISYEYNNGSMVYHPSLMRLVQQFSQDSGWSIKEGVVHQGLSNEDIKYVFFRKKMPRVGDWSGILKSGSLRPLSLLEDKEFGKVKKEIDALANHEYAQGTMFPIPEETWSEITLRDKHSSLSQVFFDTQGKVVGFVLAYPTTAKDAVIEKIAVDPQYRKSGVLTGLLNALAKRASLMHIESLYLAVLKTNILAQGAYESLGFRNLTPERVVDDRQYNALAYTVSASQLSDITDAKLEMVDKAQTSLIAENEDIDVQISAIKAIVRKTRANWLELFSLGRRKLNLVDGSKTTVALMAQALGIPRNKIDVAIDHFSFSKDELGFEQLRGPKRRESNLKRVETAIADLKAEGKEISFKNVQLRAGLSRSAMTRLGRKELEKQGIVFYDGKGVSERLMEQRINEIKGKLAQSPGMKSTELPLSYRDQLGQGVLASIGVRTPRAISEQRRVNLRKAILMLLKNDPQPPSYELLSRELASLKLEDVSAPALGKWSENNTESVLGEGSSSFMNRWDIFTKWGLVSEEQNFEQEAIDLEEPSVVPIERKRQATKLFSEWRTLDQLKRAIASQWALPLDWAGAILERILYEKPDTAGRSAVLLQLIDRYELKSFNGQITPEMKREFEDLFRLGRNYYVSEFPLAVGNLTRTLTKGKGEPVEVRKFAAVKIAELFSELVSDDQMKNDIFKRISALARDVKPDQAMNSKLFQYSDEGRMPISLNVDTDILAQGFSQDELIHIKDAVYKKAKDAIEQGRSLIISLKKPFVYKGRTLRLLQIKGVIYKGGFPQMKPYVYSPGDIMMPSEDKYQVINGMLHYRKASEHPQGAMLLTDAQNEYIVMKRAFLRGVDTGLPIAFGRWDSMEFKRQDTGFVVIALEAMGDGRLGQAIGVEMSKIEKDKTPGVEKKRKYWGNMLQLVGDAARSLRALHDKQIIHGQPHLYQFAKLKDGKVRIYDFEDTRLKDGMTKDEFVYRLYHDFIALGMNALLSVGGEGYISKKQAYVKYGFFDPSTEIFKRYFTPTEIGAISQKYDLGDEFQKLLKMTNAFWVLTLKKDQPVSVLFKDLNANPLGRLIVERAGKIYDQQMPDQAMITVGQILKTFRKINAWLDSVRNEGPTAGHGGPLDINMFFRYQTAWKVGLLKQMNRILPEKGEGLHIVLIGPGKDAEDLKAVLDNFPLAKRIDVMDVGDRFYAIEKIKNERAGQVLPQINFFQHSISNMPGVLPAELNGADLVLSFNVLDAECFSGTAFRRIHENIKRMLKPKGIFIMNYAGPQYPNYYTDRWVKKAFFDKYNFELEDPGSGFLFAVKKDRAQIANDQSRGRGLAKGGIDLTSANMNLQTRIDSSSAAQNDASVGIKFHLDPAHLQQLHDASGFVPVIISVRPVADLRKFLGGT